MPTSKIALLSVAIWLETRNPFRDFTTLKRWLHTSAALRKAAAQPPGALLCRSLHLSAAL